MTQQEQLRTLYQSFGVVFRAGHVVIPLGAKGTLELNEKYFLEPSEKGFRELNDIVKRQIGVEFELFDAKDKKYEAQVNGKYERYLGRAYHHEEWVCCPLKQRKYYTYVKLTAPMDQVSPDSWEKMAQYLLCVLATLGILVVLGILTSGTSVAASSALFAATCAACLAVIQAINQEEKEAAIITTPIER
jgi:hypothetical protein